MLDSEVLGEFGAALVDFVWQQILLHELVTSSPVCKERFLSFVMNKQEKTSNAHKEGEFSVLIRGLKNEGRVTKVSHIYSRAIS